MRKVVQALVGGKMLAVEAEARGRGVKGKSQGKADFLWGLLVNLVF